MPELKSINGFLGNVPVYCELKISLGRESRLEIIVQMHTIWNGPPFLKWEALCTRPISGMERQIELSTTSIVLHKLMKANLL